MLYDILQQTFQIYGCLIFVFDIYLVNVHIISKTNFLMKKIFASILLSIRYITFTKTELIEYNDEYNVPNI